MQPSNLWSARAEAFQSGIAARRFRTVACAVLGELMTPAGVSGIAWRAPPLRRLRRIEVHGVLDVVPMTGVEGGDADASAPARGIATCRTN